MLAPLVRTSLPAPVACSTDGSCQPLSTAPSRPFAPAPQAALRKELCQRHPALVEALAAPGAKLRLQDVLLHQAANPDDRDPDPHPDPWSAQGQGGNADEDRWEQLYAEDSSGSGGSEASAAGAEARDGWGAGQEAGGAEDACRLLPEFFVLRNTAKGEPVERQLLPTAPSPRCPCVQRPRLTCGTCTRAVRRSLRCPRMASWLRTPPWIVCRWGPTCRGGWTG